MCVLGAQAWEEQAWLLLTPCAWSCRAASQGPLRNELSYLHEEGKDTLGPLLHDRLPTTEVSMMTKGDVRGKLSSTRFSEEVTRPLSWVTCWPPPSEATPAPPPAQGDKTCGRDAEPSQVGG